MKYRILRVVLLLLIPFTTFAQIGRSEFGKNRLQYKNFKWYYYSSENFDVYYYEGGQKQAKFAVDYLEKEFDAMTDILGAAPYNKTKILIYNSITDLQQSNIGVHDNEMRIGGKTDFINTQIEVAYPGEMEGFQDELVYRTSLMFINEMMFGGSFGDMFQSSYLLNLPEWYIKGAARYVAYEWDEKMDDYIRDVIRRGGLKKLGMLQGDDAAIIGQSIWNYIAEKYGMVYISNILNLTRIIRNEEKSITGTLGIPYKLFVQEWMAYYGGHAEFVRENYVSPPEENATKAKKKDIKYSQIRLNPRGNLLAYVVNYRGKYKVILTDLSSGKKKRVFSGGYKVINQQIDYVKPIISWKDDNTLGVISDKFGRDFLWMINVQNGKKIRKELGRIDQVLDFDILKNGNIAVISAVSGGRNDLFLVSLRKNSIKKITNDIYDDLHPRFVPGTSSIVFSTNRPNDTLNLKNPKVDEVGQYSNIFVYNIDTTRTRLTRLTNNLSKNYRPVAVNGTEIYFLSDQQGIVNLFKFNIENRIFHQVSNLDRNIKDFTISQEKDKFAFIALKKKREAAYVMDSYNLDQNIFTMQTPMRQLKNAKFVASKIKASEKLEEPDEETIIKEKASQVSVIDLIVPDSIITGDGINTNEFEFTQIEREDSEFIDAEDYVFETDVVKSKTSNSFLSAYRKLASKREVMGPFPYKEKFRADNLISSFVIDPLLGFGLKLETTMSDQMENHKMYGGILATTDLKSGRLYGEYQYLKFGVDFNFRYDRKTYVLPSSDQSLQKYALNQFSVGASIPFSISTRLSVTPFYAFSNFFDLDPLNNSLSPPTGENNTFFDYVGVTTEFVFDNSTQSGRNLIQGTRGKISFSHYEGLTDNNKTFSNISVDFRNYQKISRQIVFATRVFYGYFFGRSPKNYMLGGMENWFFPNTNTRGEGNPLVFEKQVDNSDILFSEFVTSLRGFDLNEFYGHSSMLFNAELRVPIVQYFSSGQISSNFLRNLMFIGFFDIGSAWSTGSPFSRTNSVNNEIVNTGSEDNPLFVAKVQNFKNPWLYSYGFGMRTVMLGYFLKMDVAYPYNDYQRQDARFFVTLGYDF